MKKILITLVGCVVALQASAQVKGGWGINATGMVYSDVLILQPIATYNWHVGQRFTLSAGGGALVALNASYKSTEPRPNISYQVEDREYHLLGELAAMWRQPLGHKNGLFCRGSFQFDPLPWHSIGLEKTNLNGEAKHVKDTPSKFCFSGFSPGVFGEVGWYHDLPKCRMAIGAGYGWYDLYKAYRHNTIDGQRLADFAPDDKTYFRLSLHIIPL